MLRTMIKEHHQQAKAKATPKKLTYDDFEEEGSDSSEIRGLKTSSHLRRSERLKNKSKSKAKPREGRTKSRTRRHEYKGTSLDSDHEEDSKDTYEDLSIPYKRPKPTPFTTRITHFKYQ
ncbi:hypothetical protein Tco_1485680 [Tanacetum coccineum]